jgi:hypothetical protein
VSTGCYWPRAGGVAPRIVRANNLARKPRASAAGCDADESGCTSARRRRYRRPPGRTATRSSPGGQEQRAPSQDARPWRPLESLDAGGRVLDVLRPGLPAVPRPEPGAPGAGAPARAPRGTCGTARHGARTGRAPARSPWMAPVPPPSSWARGVHVPCLDAARSVHRVDHLTPPPVGSGRAHGADPAPPRRVEQSPLRVPCSGDGETRQQLADEQHGVAGPADEVSRCGGDTTTAFS